MTRGQASLMLLELWRRIQAAFGILRYGVPYVELHGSGTGTEISHLQLHRCDLRVSKPGVTIKGRNVGRPRIAFPQVINAVYKESPR